MEKIGADLDNIVLKALHKDPARRYASAGELSEDLRRYLQGFPVLARAGFLAVPTSRFVSRHRWRPRPRRCLPVTTTALAIGLALETRRDASRSRHRKPHLGFSGESLRRVSALNRMQGRSANVRDILDRGAERIPAELAGQPLVEARLFNILGTTYRELGVFDRAEALLNQAQQFATACWVPIPGKPPNRLLTLRRDRQRPGRLRSRRPLLSAER